MGALAGYEDLVLSPFSFIVAPIDLVKNEVLPHGQSLWVKMALFVGFSTAEGWMVKIVGDGFSTAE